MGTAHWNLSDRSPEELLASASEWFKVLAVLRAEEADPAVFREVFTRAVRDLTALGAQEPTRWYDLMRTLLTWAYWRRPDDEHGPLVAEVQATQTDLQHQQEIQIMTSKLGPTIFEKGLAQGEAKGRAEGKAEGKAEGELRMARAILLALVQDRFGAVSEPLAQRIEATDDLNRLQTALRRVYQVARLDELEV